MDSVLSLLRVSHLALSSNFFGLGCPFYCGSPLLGTLLASFLLGLISGIVLALAGLFLLFPGLRPYLGFAPQAPGTCMSVSAEEDSVVELDIQFSGLSISVRGAPDTAARLVQHISSTHHGTSSAYSPPASPSPASVPPVDLHSTGHPRPSPSSAPGLASGTTSTFPTRASVEASFPPCPASWIGAASARLSGSKSSPTSRAQRAWKAGQWARAVQEGRAQSPNQTETSTSPTGFGVWSEDLISLGQKYTTPPGTSSRRKHASTSTGRVRSSLAHHRDHDHLWQVRVARGIHCVRLELPAGDTPEEGVCQALALVVLRRRGGLLLCVAQGYFPEETLALEQVGQSLSTTIAAGT